jgi:hypothetical protein
LGIAGGVVALLNILGRHLTRGTEDILLVLGIMHWFLGGLVCWALEGIQIHATQTRWARMQAIAAESLHVRLH